MVNNKKIVVTEMLILAGGLGKRLQSVVFDVPKPMAPINNVPFLEYLLDFWISRGIKKFIISIGYKSILIKDYFKNQYNGVEIFYIEEEDPLGTGGAIKKALLSEHWLSEDIIVSNGDTWFEIDMIKFIEDSLLNNRPITIALKSIDYNDRYGSVIIDDRGLISNFTSNTLGLNLINGGCYILNRRFFVNYFVNYLNKFSFENDVLESLAKQKMIGSSIQDGKFIDIGIPSDYERSGSIIKKT